MTAPDTDTLAGLLAEATPAMDGLRRIKADDWSVEMPGDGGWSYVGREDDAPRIIVIERGWGKSADARQDAVERLCILAPALAAEVIALRAQVAKDKARIERLEAALLEIADCGQSAEPDHWKFRCMARGKARAALEDRE